MPTGAGIAVKSPRLPAYGRAKITERSRLVYSSDFGRPCPDCGKPMEDCTCARKQPREPGDGIVRVRRESKGRGGKTVTTIAGLPVEDAALEALAGELKRRCGCGGTAKEGTIVIQGDHVEHLVGELQRRGYTTKRAGEWTCRRALGASGPLGPDLRRSRHAGGPLSGPPAPAPSGEGGPSAPFSRARPAVAPRCRARRAR